MTGILVPRPRSRPLPASFIAALLPAFFHPHFHPDPRKDNALQTLAPTYIL